jgi:hypothetical protein
MDLSTESLSRRKVLVASTAIGPGRYSPARLRRPQRCIKPAGSRDLLRKVRPNPSLKRSANGRPPGPAWRYAVHFRQSGPGVLPLSPA